VNGAENPQEHFLGEIEGFIPVIQQVERELNDHPLVLGDELGAGRLVAERTLLHQRGFAGADIRPTRDAHLFHGVCPVPPFKL